MLGNDTVTVPSILAGDCTVRRKGDARDAN